MNKKQFNKLIKKISFPFVITFLSGVLGGTMISAPLFFHQKHKVASELVEKPKATLSARLCTEGDNRRLFYGVFSKKDVYPVEVTIQNRTPNTLYINEESVDVPFLTGRELGKEASKNLNVKHIGSRVGLGIAGFFFWPAMIVDTLHSGVLMKNKHEMKRDLESKVLKEMRIPPYSTSTRVLFIPKAELDAKRGSFAVSLLDERLGKEHSYKLSVNLPNDEE